MAVDNGFPTETHASQVDNILDSAFRTANPATRKPSNSVKRQVYEQQNDNYYLDDLDLAKRRPSEPADQSSGTMIENAFQNSIRMRHVDKHYSDIARKMQFPHQEMTSAGASRDAYRAPQPFDDSKKTPKRATRTVRSRPTVGRTIEVIPEKGVDFGRALRNLHRLCSENRVATDLKSQRFHERPGLKKKRLKRERWRKRFMESFIATVRRVREMRRKGW
ncbi:MAG: hypothetical protein Q9175_000192 [Cornicularia normoerica]